jgi:hypothetical protein
MIYKREDYVEESDQQGAKFPVKHIEALSPLDGSKTTYVGQVTLGIQTPMGVQQIPISFEIQADTVIEAFKKFEESAEPRVDEARRQIEEEIDKLRMEAASRIIRPGEVGMTPGAIAGGNVLDFKKLKQ